MMSISCIGRVLSHFRTLEEVIILTLNCGHKVISYPRCMSFLLPHNKCPQTQELLTIGTYLTALVSEESSVQNPPG